MSQRNFFTGFVILFLSTLILQAEQKETDGNVLKGKAAFSDWRSDKPGVRRLLTPQDLPEPSPDESAENRPGKIPMPAGAKPVVPEGFTIEMVASGLTSPRVIRVAPNGDLFVADSKANAVRVYRVPAGASKPASSSVYASDLRQPYGIAFYPLGKNPAWVYIANNDSVVRFPYRSGDMKATGKPERIVERILWTHHWTRDLVFAPDGKKFFLAVGSGSNVALDMFPTPLEMDLESWKKTKPLGAAWDTEERRAVVLSFDPDGKNESTYATGLRNCSGMTFQPDTGNLWCVVNERDLLGDNTPFEYATAVKQGAFYGWPWYYIGGNEDPNHKGKRPDLKDQVTLPDVLIQAHSAPLQIVFYQGDGFGPEYKGSAFVTLHGSWNRGKRTGYKVVRLPFDKNGKPTGEYEDFITGFVVSDQEVWGRPVGLAVANDGSLFLTEDGSGSIWRLSRAKL